MDSTRTSPFTDSPQESSEDNLENDSLDEFGPVAGGDSGVSEVGSQMSEEVGSEVTTVSVSEEIKKFQREINTVATENSRFFTWKQQRAGQLRQLSVSSENLSVRGGPDLQVQPGRTSHYRFVFQRTTAVLVSQTPPLQTTYRSRSRG